ncbi:MAG: DUF1778 domain-containing protein [Symploca sp. SIO2D2]|nr:DUF1778 domain-containing protein [Symploca sp. SIO2D2]
MASTSPNDTRVTARIPASVKDTLQKAAVKEAQEVINTEQLIHLSPQDADRIFSLIENPPAPNQHLKEAIKQHQAFFQWIMDNG